MSEIYKILIADDHPIVRDGFKLLIEMQDEISAEVVECLNGKEVLDTIRENKIDLILLDISMPIVSGLEVLKILRTELNFEAPILILSSLNNKKIILEANELGANGYILKNATADELMFAISKALNHQKYFSQEIAEILLANPNESAQIKSLTPREKEILILICNEKTNQQIADELYISIRTVEGHRERLLKKISVISTVGLVKFAVKNGLDN